MRSTHLYQTLWTIAMLLAVNWSYSQSKQDYAAFERARICNTIPCFKTYLSEYPNGFFSKNVREQINKVENRNENVSTALNKIKSQSKLKKILLGNRPDLAIMIEALEGGKAFQIGLPLYSSTPFGLSMALIGFLPEDDYIKTSVSAFDFSGYISIRGGMGFYLSGGYRPGFIPSKPTDNYFFSSTDPPAPQFLLRSYEPGDIEIKVSKLHYGFGYQNVFGRLLLGINFEWYDNFYKADASERLNYNGLDSKISDSSLNFRMGWVFEL